MWSTAASKSASSKTTFGFLPPSSRAMFFTSRAADSMIRRPVPRPPVKDTRSTSGCTVIADPTVAPAPRTRLATPGGAPASSMSRIMAMVVSGVISLGLRTNVLPAASAGATFQEAWSSG